MHTHRLLLLFPFLASLPLSRTGTVQVGSAIARFVRPELAEEYSVSADGPPLPVHDLEPLVGRPRTRTFQHQPGLRAGGASRPTLKDAA